MSGGELTVAAAALLSFFSIASVIRALSGAQYTMFAFIPILVWAGFALGRFLIRGEAKFRTQGYFLAALATLFLLAVFSYMLFRVELKGKLDAIRETAQIVKMLVTSDPGLEGLKSDLPALKGIYGASYFDAYARCLESRTKPGEPVWAFSMHVEILPGLANRHNATRFPVIVVLMGSADYQKAYVSELEKERPRYLLFNPNAQYGIQPLKPYFKPVFGYIHENYIPDPDFPGGEYNPVWVRRDVAYPFPVSVQ